MRSSVISAIKASALQGLNISNELPYEDGGVPIYLKNPRTVYIDEKTVDTQPLISTLGGLSISTSTTSVKVYFTTDAKNIQPSYSSNIELLKGLKDTIDFAGANSRDVTITTDYVNDMLVTEVDYQMTKLL